MRRALGALALACLIGAVQVSVADAANRRISISNYQWSDDTVAIDRGEHVTWYWVGPDTMHSITGLPPEADGLDSDLNNNTPQHAIGDEFKLDFDKPGAYEFQCKLHSSVRGTVVVSDAPGNPTFEPDPVPRSKVDLRSPNLRDVRLDSYSFRRGGTILRYSVNEPSKIQVEFFRLEGKRGKRRRFAGYEKHGKGHIGFNRLGFGRKRSTFKAKPGRYRAKVVAIDGSANRTRPAKIDFRIRGRR